MVVGAMKGHAVITIKITECVGEQMPAGIPHRVVRTVTVKYSPQKGPWIKGDK